MTTYRLHYFPESGNSYKLALMLTLCAQSFERVWTLGRMRARGRGVIDRVAAMGNLDLPFLRRESARAGNQPIARLLRVPLDFPDERNHQRLGDLIEEAILHEVPRIDRSLWVLDTIVTLSPLLGLLGTIIGMFNAFQALNNPGVAPTEITGGIAEALVATASGLFVAIIGLVFYNGLQTRVRLLVHDLETLKVVLVNRLDGQAGRADGEVVHAAARVRQREA